jgi:ribosomal protein L30/L7E
MPDLQDIVDDLEAEIRRPISVEDRRWRLLAHSVQPDETDRVRMQSILSRETSPDVAAWLEGLGLQRARELVEVPENPALGMTRRGCLPLRHGDVLLGFLWVIVGDQPLTELERAALARGGEEAAVNLWARLQAADERRRRVNAALEAAGRGDAGELAIALRWPPVGAYAVAVTAGGEQVAERLRRRRSDFAWVEHGDGLLFVARDPDGFAGALADAGAQGGVSARFAALNRTPEALAEAETAALVARATAKAIASYDELGSWALVARLWLDAGRPAPPREITALAEHRRGGELLEALEGLLEAGGDVAEAAKALHVHRATLYRRLERVEEITGYDLESGDDRLAAHLGLRLYRLAR